MSSILATALITLGSVISYVVVVLSLSLTGFDKQSTVFVWNNTNDVCIDFASERIEVNSVYDQNTCSSILFDWVDLENATFVIALDLQTSENHSFWVKSIQKTSYKNLEIALSGNSSLILTNLTPNTWLWVLSAISDNNQTYQFVFMDCVGIIYAQDASGDGFPPDAEVYYKPYMIENYYDIAWLYLSSLHGWNNSNTWTSNKLTVVNWTAVVDMFGKIYITTTLSVPTCSCPHGFVHTSLGGCMDINECDNHSSSPCSPHAQCSNTVGSYNCSCNHGYNGNGFLCVPSLPDCDGNASLYFVHNLQPECICNMGFSGAGRNGTCVPNGICAENHQQGCPNFSFCNTTAGRCQCKPGSVGVISLAASFCQPCPLGSYSAGGMATACTSCAAGLYGSLVNQTSQCLQCPAGRHSLHAGSVTCTACPQGFTSVEGQTDCQDVDECAENNTLCPVTLRCSNTLGSYSCNCPENTTLCFGNCTLSLSGSWACDCDDYTVWDNSSLTCSARSFLALCRERNPCSLQFRCESMSLWPYYTCSTCYDGYELSGDTCIPINLCNESYSNALNCDLNTSSCVYNSSVGSVCQCDVGFQINPASVQNDLQSVNCINASLACSAGNCQTNAECVSLNLTQMLHDTNTSGRTACDPNSGCWRCECNAPLIYDPQDISGCQLPVVPCSQCGQGTACNATLNQCVCLPGQYAVVSNQSNASNINVQCAPRLCTDVWCPSNSTCQDVFDQTLNVTVPSCRCNTGFYPVDTSNTSCAPIVLCTDVVLSTPSYNVASACGPFGTCQNTSRHFVCDCPNATASVIIDNTSLFSPQYCAPLELNFCNSGFVQSFLPNISDFNTTQSNKTAAELNATLGCDANTTTCQIETLDYGKEWRCKCKLGFEPYPNGTRPRSCQDIDECAILEEIKVIDNLVALLKSQQAENVTYEQYLQLQAQEQQLYDNQSALFSQLWPEENWSSNFSSHLPLFFNLVQCYQNPFSQCINTFGSWYCGCQPIAVEYSLAVCVDSLDPNQNSSLFGNNNQSSSSASNSSCCETTDPNTNLTVFGACITPIPGDLSHLCDFDNVIRNQSNFTAQDWTCINSTKVVAGFCFPTFEDPCFQNVCGSQVANQTIYISDNLGVQDLELITCQFDPLLLTTRCGCVQGFTYYPDGGVFVNGTDLIPVQAASGNQSVLDEWVLLYGPPMTCVDFDECTLQSSNQHCNTRLENSRCQNTYGSFVCVCDTPLYELDFATNLCYRPDLLCQNVACDTNSTLGCATVQGRNLSYCPCKTGFKPAFGNYSATFCLDVNECTDNFAQVCDPTSTLCVNTVGSYSCECRDGFFLKQIRDFGVNGSNNSLWSCVDINECDLFVNPCLTLPGALTAFGPRCVNLLGSFQCLNCLANGTCLALCDQGSAPSSADVSNYSCQPIQACGTFITPLGENNTNLPPATCLGQQEVCSSLGRCVCQDGYARNVLSIPDCSQCDLGYVAAPGLSNGTSSSGSELFCQPCDAGFVRLEADTACRLCEAGRVFESIKNCASCPVNTFAPYAGSSLCEPCPAFEISPEGASACNPCDNSSVPDFATGLCVACPPYSYKDGPEGIACIACDENQVASVSDWWGTCVDCPAGTERIAPFVVCTSCRPGFVSNVSGTPCLRCPNGTTSDFSLTVCI